jgi:hypothetical protein
MLKTRSARPLAELCTGSPPERPQSGLGPGLERLGHLALDCADEWAPLNLHTGAFSVGASAATAATVTGKDGAAACMGDTGGLMVRVTGGTHQIVALASQSYQGGCYGIDESVTSTSGTVARVDDLASWVNGKIGAPGVTDFNCDGIEDVAVADPAASVGGTSGAGLIRIAYGGGKGTAEINQALDWVPDAPETNDWFGEVIDTVDYNQDGCTARGTDLFFSVGLSPW